ncbi:MAG: 50S ribosomal protein L20 [Deltaproteobacteria bacterium]|nr:50S ribosomal protein L20 [Deltaproteobacteria bacterium]
MRVKRGFKAKRRRKKILKLAKGHRGGRSKLFRTAADAVDKALMYAYRDRKARKRDFRRLWITRLNAAARMNSLSYSKFIHGLKLAGINLDRKVLAELAISDPSGFAQIANLASPRVSEILQPIEIKCFLKNTTFLILFSPCFAIWRDE